MAKAAFSKGLFWLFALLGAFALLDSLAVTAAGAEDWLVGNREQGGVFRGVLPGTEKLYVEGREVRLAADGSFVFGVTRDHEGDLDLLVKEASGRERNITLAISRRDYKIQRIEGVPQEYVTPPEAVLERIRQEAEAVAEVRQKDLDGEGFRQKFIWPGKGVITGVYGSQRFYNGQARSPHYGIDIAAPKGTRVIAPAAGKVTFIRDLYYSGGTLILDHGHGLTSTFLHMDRFSVAVGQVLQQGQEIGAVGASGRATGPHLDWRMNWFAVRVDPQSLVKGEPESLKDSQ